MRRAWAAAALSICITGVIQAQEDDILDIRPMREAGFWEANWQWAAPVLAGVLIVAAVALYFALRRKPEKPLTAYQRAMKEIAEASGLKDGGNDKAFSIAVSNALRNYIEAVFRIRAPEQTTEEFLSSAKSHPRISADALKTLGTFLELCDLAKFARHAFGPEERDQLIATAKEFVEQARTELREYLDVSDMKFKTKEIDKESILPRLKTHAFLDTVKAHTKNPKDLPITKAFLEDLIVVYAFDDGDSYQFVSGWNLDSLKLDINELHSLALANLKRYVSEMSIQRIGNSALLNTGNQLESCLLLLDSVWEGLSAELGGSLVIAVPTRDLLVVTGSRDEEDLQALRDIVLKANEPEQDRTHNLSDNLYERIDGRWEVFEKVL